MTQIKKLVFISYQRTNSLLALAIFQALSANNYDVFIDYNTIDLGKFDDAILNQIKGREYFIIILTPGAVTQGRDSYEDRFRYEIEIAIKHKRIIIPVMLAGYGWDKIEKYFTSKFDVLGHLNSLSITLSSFGEAMNQLQTQFLTNNNPIALQPISQADEQVAAQKLDHAQNQPSVTEEQLIAIDYFERAYQHQIKYGEQNEAISNYTEAIRHNPNYIDAYNNRGDIFFSKKDYNHTIADYNDVLHINPQSAIVYAKYGLAKLYQYRPQYNQEGNNENEEEYNSALHYYHKALQLDRESICVYIHIGTGEFRHYGKNYDYAIDAYTNLIQQSPYHHLLLTAYVSRAVAYIGRFNTNHDANDYSRGIADYTEAIRLTTLEKRFSVMNEFVSSLYYLRGCAYLMKTNDEAIADFTRALQLNPQYVVIYNQRGNAYQRKRDYDHAIEDYTEELRLNPQNSIAYNNRGICYFFKKEYDLAIADYDRAIELDPTNATINSNRDNALKENKKHGRRWFRRG